MEHYFYQYKSISDILHFNVINVGVDQIQIKKLVRAVSETQFLWNNAKQLCTNYVFWISLLAVQDYILTKITATWYHTVYNKVWQNQYNIVK